MILIQNWLNNKKRKQLSGKILKQSSLGFNVETNTRFSVNDLK